MRSNASNRMSLSYFAKLGKVESKPEHKYIDFAFNTIDDIGGVSNRLILQCKSCMKECDNIIGTFYNEAYIHVVNEHWINFPKIIKTERGSLDISCGPLQSEEPVDLSADPLRSKESTVYHNIWSELIYVASKEYLNLLLLTGDLLPLNNFIKNMCLRYVENGKKKTIGNLRKKIFREVRKYLTTCILCGKEYDCIPTEELIMAHIGKCSA